MTRRRVPGPMRGSSVLLGVLLGVALAAGVAMLEPDGAPEPAPTAADEPGHGAMNASEACSHMPEHCQPEGP